MITRALADFGRRIDWILVLSTLGLSLIGLITIYSVDLSRGSALNFFSTQVISLGLGVAVLFILSGIHSTRFENGARLFFLLNVFLLVGVLFFGTTIRGTRGWFRLAGFSFQPVEIAKVALLIFLAWRIERAGRQFNRATFVWSTGIMTGLLVGPILLQPDFGSGLVMIALWLGLVVLAGIRPGFIFGLVAVGLVCLLLGWLFFFKSYQKDRLLTFVNPTRDPLGAGYNVNQSMIAIGSGQLLGRGLGFGSQSQLHFLPEAQTDFIISVIGEELGFVGLALILGLYGILLFRLVSIGSRVRSDFGAYAVFGVAILFSVQLTVNMGAAIGILPVTGVTLPFVSYGGSSLISNYILIGLVLSINRQTRLA